MKHLKKFNEELEPSTYLLASQKLNKIGHNRRSKELESWGKMAKWKASMKEWEKNIEKYSPWGKATFKFNVDGEVFSRDFYLLFNFDEYLNSDSLLHNKESKGYFGFRIQFELGLIPADEETLQKCLGLFPDSDFSKGFFWANWIMIHYKVENEKLSFDKISITPFDDGDMLGEPELVDRKGALVLKRSLIACIDEDQDYPSSDSGYRTMHDLIFRCICQKCEMLVDYNLDMERMLNDVKSYSHNHFFKD